MAPNQTRPPVRPGFRIPIVYTFFFLLAEPILTLVGTFRVYTKYARYLEIVDTTTPYAVIPAAVSDMASIYAFFTGCSSTAVIAPTRADMGFWRILLTARLVSDLCCLYTMGVLGSSVYYDAAASWDVSRVGKVLWVCLRLSMRLCFLAGVGLGDM